MDTNNIPNGCEQKMEHVNGEAVEEKFEVVTAAVDSADDDVLLNNTTKPVNTKLLKKSQSENLDLMNKNVESINGEPNEAENDGPKRIAYAYDFLMSLRSSPNSTKKPEHVPKLYSLNLIAADNANKLLRMQSTSRGGEAKTDNGNFASLMGNSQFVPMFARSSATRGGTPNRRSQHGKQGAKDTPRAGGGGSGSGGGNGGRQSSSVGGKPNIIQINLSRDVKLNEAENAWKPNKMRKEPKKEAAEDEPASDKQEICKKFRSILNKLSPQNFQKLIQQVHTLKIDTSDKLSSVIDLVFEKAVDEPGFSETYALMCKELETIKVKQTQEDGNAEQIVSFRKLIIKSCQNEFEKASVEERTSSLKQKEIDECTDPDKKKELLFILTEGERKARMRSVGNVRFIGELFKQKYISANIMIICVESLIKKLEEETMECLCKLLTTVGKDLEKNYNMNLQKYFNDMKAIAENKDNKLNSRIRFMLQDVIDLRMCGWVPRQKLATPKKLDEIQMESEAERMNKNPYSKFSSSMSTQRDDRAYSGRNPGSRSVTEDGGWSVAPARGRGPRQPYVVDPAKLKMMNISDKLSDISLQPSTNAMWSRGSNTKKDVPAASVKPNLPPSTGKKNLTKTSNAFTALVDLPADVVASEKPDEKEMEIRKASVTDENIQKSENFKSLKDEFLACSGDPYSELLDNIKHYFTKDMTPCVIRELILFGLEFKKSKVLQVIGKASATLVNNQTISPEEFAEAFKQSVDMSTQFEETDVWDLLSKFVWAHSKEHELSFWELHKISAKIISIEKGFDFLMALFMEKIEDCNEQHVVKKLWKESTNMKLTDWMSASNADEFLKCMPLEFITPEENDLDSKITKGPTHLMDSILNMMKNRTTIDSFNVWIKTNVQNIEELGFINALTEAVYTYTLCSPEFPGPRFDNKSKERLDFYYPLLITYVANKPPLELECLLSLQNLIHILEHPQGIALQLFEHLWDSGEAVSNDAFLRWEADTTKLEGKGVMLMTLTSFFTSLKADDDSSSEDSSEENSPISIENEY